MLKQVFTPTVMEDADRTQKARVLFWLLWGLIVVTTITGLADCLVLPQNLIRWLAVMFVMDAMCLGLLVLNRRKHTRLASRLLLWVLLGVVMELAWTGGGIHAGIIYYVPLVPLIAGLLLNWRAGIITGLFCALCELGLVLADHAGLLPASAVRHTTLSLSVTSVAVLALLLLLQYLAVESINQALKAERESKRRFRAIFDSTFQFIGLLRTDGSILEINEAALEFGGFKLDEIRGKFFWDTRWWSLSPEIQLQLKTAVAQAAGGEFVRYEVNVRGKDDRVMVIDFSLKPIRDESGSVLLLLPEGRDITERKQAEAALRESQEKFVKVFQNAPILIAITDLADATYLDVNAEALRISGFTREEVIGRRAADLGWITTADRDRMLKELREKGRISDLEMTFQAKGGRQLHGLVKGEQIFLGGRPCLLTVALDITERKQLEANFLRAQRMEGLGALAGGIAHDLNNILQPILMTSSLLRETTSDPENREMVDTMESCARRGADIIRQLLTFARGKPSARVPLPIRHLLHEMDKLIRETFPRNIQLRVTVPQNLWQVLGDATQLHQVFMNLCVNARDAMPNGGTLTLMAENLTLDESSAATMPGAKPGRHVCISVADTGMGISPENLDRIFDPFFTTKEIGKGTGLGLATVLGIVRGHDGFVRVNSQVGKGTVFDLYLPASAEGSTSAMPEPEPLPPRAEGELILVVDDEDSVRSVIQRTLEKHGYRVVVAAEGAAAMSLFNRHRAEIRAVITDMMMPGMDGPALVRALRQLEPQLPILGMTGMGEKTDIKELNNIDQVKLLTKPFKISELLNTLHQAKYPGT
jgi:PAS domain S-box-containing protein